MDLVVYHGYAQVGVVQVEVEGDAPHHDQPEGQLHDLRQGANVIKKYYSLFLQNFHKCELQYDFFSARRRC